MDKAAFYDKDLKYPLYGVMDPYTGKLTPSENFKMTVSNTNFLAESGDDIMSVLSPIGAGSASRTNLQGSEGGVNGKLPSAKGSFSVGGRDFDGGIGNKWWEAKSGSYWESRINDPKAIAKFKSDMGTRLTIAQENGATYELFSNTPIPQVFKDYLIKKGIPFIELLD